MSAHENKNNQSPSSFAPLHDEEEMTRQYALAEECLNQEWKNNPRWRGIERPYTAADVLRLRGSIHIEHTLARLGAERLWDLLQSETYVNALGAVTGNQAVQQVQAGLKAIYVSGWQVAADANNAGQMYRRIAFPIFAGGLTARCSGRIRFIMQRARLRRRRLGLRHWWRMRRRGLAAR